MGLLLVVWLIQRQPINKKALNLFLFFILSQSLSLVNGNLGAGLVRLDQYLMAGLFGIYIASAKWEVLRGKLFLPLSLAILGESILAILQFLKGGTIGLWILGERTFSITTPAIAKFDFRGFEFLRPYATFPHPNVLAGFMVIGIMLVSWIAYQGVNRRGGLLNLSMLLGTITLLLTVSRVALIAGVAMAMMTLSRRWKIVLVLLLIILSPILFTRFEALFSFDSLTLIRREELSISAWQMFLSSPIFGIGLNNFIPASSEGLVSGPSRFLQPVHNIFLLALAETGILGLLGLLGLIGYPIWKLFKLRTTNPEPKTLLLIWVVIIFLGLFDHYFLTLPQGYRLLFLIWGISLSMLEWKNAKSS